MRPKIIIVGQGQKRAYLGEEVYVYDPFNCLVLPVPLPAECEADASPEKPVLLVAIHVDASMLGELILELDEPLSPAGPTPRGISTAPMSEALSGAVIRLLECLKCPLDSRLLGRQTVREIVYRLLRSEQGGAARPSPPGRTLQPHCPGLEAPARRVRRARSFGPDMQNWFGPIPMLTILHTSAQLCSGRILIFFWTFVPRLDWNESRQSGGRCCNMGKSCG
jgi:hypothetical protein